MDLSLGAGGGSESSELRKNPRREELASASGVLEGAFQPIHRKFFFLFANSGSEGPLPSDGLDLSKLR